MVLITSPSTVAVVPNSAVVDGLAAHGISGMDISTILYQDLHTAQQALTGCQMQGRGAIACLTGGPANGKRVGKKDKRTPAYQTGGQISFQACSATSLLDDTGMSLLCPAVSSAVEGGFGLNSQNLIMGEGELDGELACLELRDHYPHPLKSASLPAPSPCLAMAHKACMSWLPPPLHPLTLPHSFPTHGLCT